MPATWKWFVSVPLGRLGGWEAGRLRPSDITQRSSPHGPRAAAAGQATQNRICNINEESRCTPERGSTPDGRPGRSDRKIVDCYYLMEVMLAGKSGFRARKTSRTAFIYTRLHCPLSLLRLGGYCYPTCINTGRLERTETNLIHFTWKVTNARNPT